jgi:spore coat polysaccharide biosynthesis protein SpsF (cytidylyltransferase family)/aryl-alcohol dehydrogenase-like predicted oxidoreductase
VGHPLPQQYPRVVTAPRVRIVLQARTSSHRLPAKSLLPVAGVPLAVLCAQRLGSTGREVVLATSTEHSDDLLAALGGEHDVRIYRGSLANVLERFLGCTADLGDEDVVVRATADNPVPDGEFVDRLIQAFDAVRAPYLGCSSPADGLPFGLSAEVFTAGALRQAARERRDAYIDEHVTPHLIKMAGGNGIVPRRMFFDTDRSSLRVTIDTLEDYLVMTALFRRAGDAQRAPWRTLIELIAAPRSEPGSIEQKVVRARRYSCITLGTAQLGMDYGITNAVGRPNDTEALGIVSAALEGGVTQLDTARAYGDAELRLGRLLRRWPGYGMRVMSKLRPLTDLPDDAPRAVVEGAVDESVEHSCRDLERSRIDVMLFHRCADMFRWGGAAADRLSAHVENGTIGEIGASVYTPEEALRSLSDPRIKQLQIPFNLLDQRWLEPEFQHAVAARPDLVIHARSVFLQGLLLSAPDRWPSWAHTAPRLCSDIRRLIRSFQRKCAADLCMGFVRAFPWITSLVLGVESAAQLRELLSLACTEPLSPAETAAVGETFTDVPARLLNPVLW